MRRERILERLQARIKAAEEAHERAINVGFDLTALHQMGGETYDRRVAETRVSLEAAKAELSAHVQRVRGRKGPVGVKPRGKKGGPTPAGPVSVKRRKPRR